MVEKIKKIKETIHQVGLITKKIMTSQNMRRRNISTVLKSLISIRPLHQKSLKKKDTGNAVQSWRG